MNVLIGFYVLLAVIIYNPFAIEALQMYTEWEGVFLIGGVLTGVCAYFFGAFKVTISIFACIFILNFNKNFSLNKATDGFYIQPAETSLYTKHTPMKR